MPLDQFERRLEASDPSQAAFMLAVRRAGQGASYAPFRAGAIPWHAAVAATYAHATAPLRRLADRYVVQAGLLVANGRAPATEIADAFERLPAVMAKADARDGQIDRAVIDLAEAAVLSGREGEAFPAVVTDLAENGARIQLCDLPVVARTVAHEVLPGARIKVRLDAADVERRALSFSRIE
jgi:exoribonuclease R